ncbi:ABC-type Fe3+-siderophore transport system permease subunit [Rhizobium mesoamericanum]|nr:ABC-type Fe3+-siderophore transport system permease subunit [Rhizobium mesoamericanum]
MPFDKAFSGFSDDIVIIVGSALIVSAGVARSGNIGAVAIMIPVAFQFARKSGRSPSF